MASDGDLNVGISSESELHDFVERKRETGVYLSVLGFGSGNYKDNKMETLADHGNGAYHYVDCGRRSPGGCSAGTSVRTSCRLPTM